jgi:1,4-dihydroxy-6-naphthoate synthase
MHVLSLGYSPCPNDTFIFYGLVHGRIPLPGFSFRERLEDVETLNLLAGRGRLDVTKISFHAFGHLRGDYALLRTGGALGRGCGPLLVGRRSLSAGELSRCRIAIPGRLTTAGLLLQLYGIGGSRTVVMPYDGILAAVREGLIDAGLIIHESRFTYQDHGLACLLDLGRWWQEQTGLPLPLGGILARRSLGGRLIGAVEQAVGASAAYARRHPEEAKAYIRKHARELDDEVIDRHIALYVNEFSLDLGSEGEAAVRELLARAEERKLIPSHGGSLFAE